MIRLSSAVAVLVLVSAMKTQALDTFSSPVSINTSVCENRYWETLYTNNVDIAWRWLTNATRAELTIAGMNGTVLTTNVSPSVSNVVWQAFAPGVPSSENVYDLTLVFFGDDESVVGTQTSRVTLIKGAFGSVPVDTGPSDRGWSTVSGDVIIPYDVRWLDASVGSTPGQLVIEKEGGARQTYSLENCGGYWGWKIMGSSWGCGIFDLTLNFVDVVETWTSQVFRYAEGSLISVF